MNASTPRSRRLDRRALAAVDDALTVLDDVLAQPRDARLRGTAVLDAAALAGGLQPTPANRQYADAALRAVLADYRSLLVDALTQDYAARRAAAYASAGGRRA